MMLPGEETSPQSGRLPPEARRALVELMRQGVVMAESRRLVFDALCAHRALITDHLADMYLRVLIDEPAGIALLLNTHPEESDDTDDEDAPALISRRTLTLYDTLLLIVLRKHFLDREAAGEVRVRIDLEQIQALMMPFLPLTASSASDRKRLNGAVDSMKRRKILNAARGEEDRVEISPVIRYVVNAEMLEYLLREYQRLAEEQGSDITEVQDQERTSEDDTDV